VLVFFTPEQPGKEFATNMVIQDRIPKLLACFDRYLANKGTTFSAGNKLTVADLRIYSALTLYKSGKFQGLAIDLVNHYPKIANLYREIEGHEQLVNWKKTQS
jgi:glutathione S-transferase